MFITFNIIFFPKCQYCLVPITLLREKRDMQRRHVPHIIGRKYACLFFGHSTIPCLGCKIGCVVFSPTLRLCLCMLFALSVARIWWIIKMPFHYKREMPATAVRQLSNTYFRKVAFVQWVNSVSLDFFISICVGQEVFFLPFFSCMDSLIARLCIAMRDVNLESSTLVCWRIVSLCPVFEDWIERLTSFTTQFYF